MSSEKIITQCAQTLAGIKTGTIFNEHYEDKDELLNEIKRFNMAFIKSGIMMVPISMNNGLALIYVYRIKDLKSDFNNDISKDILNKYGYDSSNIYSSIKRLSGRFNDHHEFPHEIGLFLGFPPEDVKGFIDNDGKNFKSLGYWKVYGDENKASETFKKYRRCQKILLDRLNMGYSLKQLVIQK